MDYANDALFGDSGNSRITATDLSPYASGPDDFGRVLATGIMGTVMLAMQNKVNEATNSGQLTFSSNGVRVSPSLMQVLLVGGLIYLLVKK
jgi:hypothetical protein